MEGQKNVEETPLNQPALNPMIFHQGFPHITEQILEKMDEKSLQNCRKVSKTFQNCVDHRNILWKKIAQKNGGTKSFILACKKRQFKIAEMLIKKTTEFNVNKHDETPFHLACKGGYFEIAEMLVHESAKLNIDLNAKDYSDDTAFHIACKNGHTKTAEMLSLKLI